MEVFIYVGTALGLVMFGIVEIQSVAVHAFPQKPSAHTLSGL